MRRTKAALLVALLTLCAAFGCAQEPSTTANWALQQDALLPPFSGLGPLRDTSFTDSDRRKTGSEYEAVLPNNNVVTAGTELSFTATADGDGDNVADLAFVLYRFVLPGYGDNGV